MINKDILRDKLSKYYDKIDIINDHIFKCQKVYNNKPYQCYYFDFSDDIGDINIGRYSKQLFSEDYYSQPSLMQWNYYLAFLVNKNIEPSLKNSIEQNEDFARKLVLGYNELDTWLERNYETTKDKTAEITTDLADIWRKILKENNLDCVYSKVIATNKGVQGIIDGKFKKEKAVKESKTQTDQKLISLGNIKSLKLNKYREFPNFDDPVEFGKVNLIEGANGFGKTSLLEAIELLITGKTFRSTNSKSYNIEGSFDNIQKLVSEFDNHTLFRDRDRVWYGSMAAQRGSKLNNNFNKFNFFNTDAAFRLSNEKDQQLIETAFKDIALGEDLNYLKRELINYHSKLEMERKDRSKEVLNLQTELDKEKLTIEELRKVEKGPEKLFNILMEELNQEEWRENFPKTIDDDLDIFYAELSKIQVLFSSIQKDIDFIETIDINSLSKEHSIVIGLLESVAKLLKEKSLNEDNFRKLQKKITKSELELTLLQKVVPYYSDGIIDEIDGLNDKIQTQLKDVTRLKELKLKFERIDTSAFCNEELPLVKKRESLEIELENLCKHEKDLFQKITSFKKSLTDLQKIESQIKFHGKEFIKINSKSKECPMCQATYSTSTELKNRIKETNIRLTSSNILTDLISEKESVTLKIKQISDHISNNKALISIVERLDDLEDAVYLPLSKLIPTLTEYFIRLRSLSDCLDKLQSHKEYYLSIGINEIQFNQLKEEINTQTKYGGIKNEIELEIIILKIQRQVSNSKKELVSNKITIEGIKGDFESLLKKYDRNINKSNYKNLLETRKSNIEYYINELNSEKHILRINQNGDIRALLKKINKIIQLLNKVREEKKQKINADIISKKANTTITFNESEIKKITEENNRLIATLNVFSEISKNYNEEDYFEKFFDENKKEIQNIFLAIHSPQEFTELSIESGKIKLTRKNSKKDGLQNISTGQRSALAISVFLALNNKLQNGPNLLIFDDPVSFTDDLNTLSFLDYIRQIVLENPNKQIFFATANENIAFLFRKKFEILGKDFKRIPLKR